ncbi:Gas vesicle synthesis protein GvpA [Natrarchaeobaculum sulfurireducens]|uniref:Gas vesicle synthesis protein GvpA n=2 Tax=Natrarchaeobaculum sulfurireducens TaxID=2044521 RepID=A0A346PEE6_9EURY|nr:Gas vesicle synthesis protein GvpA [Natrarchaeobaculum sulfurireducens]
MVNEFQPSRQKTDLAEVVEMLLDKGIVINADIAVSIGDTQLLGVQVRAAIASFETAAKYGLEFPEGTDMRRVAEAAGDPELAEMERPNPAIDPTRGVNVTAEREADDGSDGEDESGSESGETEAEAGGDGGILGGGTRRGTERLGARPNPDVLTDGEMNLLDDSEVGGIGDSFPGVGAEDGESDGSDDEPDQCIALTASGERCSRSTNEDGFCHQHDESDETVDDEEIVPEGGQE